MTRPDVNCRLLLGSHWSSQQYYSQMRFLATTLLVLRLEFLPL